jgi:hypothetical protein
MGFGRCQLNIESTRAISKSLPGALMYLSRHRRTPVPGCNVVFILILDCFCPHKARLEAQLKEL